MKDDIFPGFSSDIVKKIIEESPSGIYITDLNGKFLYGNKKSESIVGYKREELIGKSVTDVILLDVKDIPKSVKLLALNKIGKETGPDEFELKRKDGKRSTVIIRTNPIEIGGRKLIIGMVEDITERKRLETELKERNGELEKIHKLSIGREMKMIQLKEEIKKLNDRIKILEKK